MGREGSGAVCGSRNGEERLGRKGKRRENKGGIEKGKKRDRDGRRSGGEEGRRERTGREGKEERWRRGEG